MGLAKQWMVSTKQSERNSECEKILKEEGEVTVVLSSAELVTICNAFYAVLNKDKDVDFNKRSTSKLYSEMIIANSICQYGHIDDFDLNQIVKHRKVVGMR